MEQDVIFAANAVVNALTGANLTYRDALAALEAAKAILQERIQHVII